jgi:hypothetical protein
MLNRASREASIGFERQWRMADGTSSADFKFMS